MIEPRTHAAITWARALYDEIEDDLVAMLQEHPVDAAAVERLDQERQWAFDDLNKIATEAGTEELPWTTLETWCGVVANAG